MDNREKDKRVAEAMGWSFSEKYKKWHHESHTEKNDIPEFTSCLNACATFEHWMESSKPEKFLEYCEEYKDHIMNYILASPEQRVDAFLKVMGVNFDDMVRKELRKESLKKLTGLGVGYKTQPNANKCREDDTKEDV